MDTSIYNISELEKAEAFAVQRELNGQPSFTMTELRNWFETKALSHPNVSRLRQRLRNSGSFISPRKGTYRLNPRKRLDLSERYQPLLRLHMEPTPTTRLGHSLFVSPTRIDELKGVRSAQYDVAKLIRICEELNHCWKGEAYFAVGVLTRVILDHIPPIFGFKNFSDVVARHPGGRSFKDATEHLDRSSRKIADGILHQQVRRKEVLPTDRQVDFSQSLDLLLSEVVSVLGH